MAGNNIADVMGCFELSNSVEVIRLQPTGGTIEGGQFTICVDGEPDFVSGITHTPSGIYFVSFTVAEQSITKKIIVAGKQSLGF